MLKNKVPELILYAVRNWLYFLDFFKNNSQYVLTISIKYTLRGGLRQFLFKPKTETNLVYHSSSLHKNYVPSF